jgi:aerobic carbon-monoxide dehydrogenase medium subunit
MNPMPRLAAVNGFKGRPGCQSLTYLSAHGQHARTMKAPNFAYCKPASLPEALDILSTQAGAVPLAGGQSLMPGLNLRLSSPDLLVDLGALDELRGIAEDASSVRVGALTTHAELMQAPIVRRCLPLVAAAIRHVGHAAIRNRGTVGGSLAYADPAAELPACCVALEASVIAANRAGRRTITASEFYTGLFETALAPDELLVEVRLPKQKPNIDWGFAELARRHGDYALVGLAASVEKDGDKIKQPRLVYFGCSDCARRAHSVENKLRGHLLPLPSYEWLADALAADLKPFDTPGLKARTKLQLALALTLRVVNDLQPGPAT